MDLVHSYRYIPRLAPASAAMQIPVKKEAREDTMKHTRSAISSGRAMRPNGWASANASRALDRAALSRGQARHLLDRPGGGVKSSISPRSTFRQKQGLRVALGCSCPCHRERRQRPRFRCTTSAGRKAPRCRSNNGNACADP